MVEFTKLGKYEIRKELGRGAMGVVYEAFDPLIERVVALKTIRPDQLAGINAHEFLARFRREAQAAGRLTHPNIVAIYDFGEDAGVWYIAMELVKGRELKEFFDGNERFTTADTVRILAQVLTALGYSHKMGVVHRDIKPSNIFIVSDGTAKVADFGIAHVESSELTQAGTVLGTPAYMSPEQILGLPVDGRSDLFSVGVILYQFLTGERPFSGNATITMRKVLEEDPLPPSRFNTQVPGAMDAVVRRALAKKADARFQSAEEFAAALTTAANAEREHSGDTTLMPAPPLPTPARNVGGAATSGSGKPVGITSGSAVASRPASRLVAMAVVAAVAVAAAVWYGMQQRSVPPAPVVAGASTGTSVPAVGALSAGAGTTANSAGGAPPAPPSAAAPPNYPGAVVISAVGLVDPSQPRFQSDAALMQTELRADSRSQLVEKAVNLLVDKASVGKNYALLRDQIMAKSGDYVTTVVREGAPQTGKDGLMTLTTEAVVNVKAVQKSLNEMSRNERVELIRASGDPRVAVRIATRDADVPNAPAQSSPAAENILKERIKSFGFRTWSEDTMRKDDPKAGPDFVIDGEVRIKRLSMRLAASGVTVTKYALNGWTIKVTDRASGEEIYFNTKLPAGDGSWVSEEQALAAIGIKIANEFSRDFFLQHVMVTGRKVMLKVDGLPPAVTDDMLRRELVAMPSVLNIAPAARPHTFELQLAGSGPAADLLAVGIVKPLNAKLGQQCFTLGAVTGDEVSVSFDAKCNDPTVIARLETNPLAALYGAPTERQKAVVSNPDTLKKLMI